MTLAAWAELDDLPPNRPAMPGGDEEWQGYLLAASEILHGLTGQRFPGLRERAVELYAPPSCGDPCGTCRPRSVRLPNRPVVELLAVRTRDGRRLDPGAYRIGRGGYLERRLANAHLPTCSVPLLLRYRYGREVGSAGRVHAAQLADALGRARLDPDSSPLPGTVTQIVRQGVTITQQAASTLIAAGQTGLAPVDLWVATVNPTRSRRPSRSWSPDTDARYYPLTIEEVP